MVKSDVPRNPLGTSRNIVYYTIFRFIPIGQTGRNLGLGGSCFITLRLPQNAPRWPVSSLCERGGQIAVWTKKARHAPLCAAMEGRARNSGTWSGGGDDLEARDTGEMPGHQRRDGLGRPQAPLRRGLHLQDLQRSQRRLRPHRVTMKAALPPCLFV